MVSTALRPLRPGEPVGVVALSGAVDAARYAVGLAALRAWGHPVVEAPNVAATRGYLAGDDGERLAGLEAVLRRGARVLVAARGGYGSARLLERIPWERLAAAGAVLVGFSDLTAVQVAAVSRGVGAVHGPMVAVGLGDGVNARRLYGVLRGEFAGRDLFRFRAEAVIRHGVGSGVAVGGNLAVLAGLCGTPYGPPETDLVLLLEEVGEPLYRLDRWLTQLRLSGTLDRVKALIFGNLASPVASGDAVRVRELLADALPGVPAVAGLPFGHGDRNLAFPLGVEVELDTWRGRLRWRA